MSTVDLAVPTVHCDACKLNIEEGSRGARRRQRRHG